MERSTSLPLTGNVTHTHLEEKIPMDEIWKLLHCSDYHTVSQKLV